MAARADGGAFKQRVGPTAVVIAVIALALFLAWRAHAAFGGYPTRPLPPPPTADINYVKQEAIACKGDFSKLPPADQQKVQQITHNWGVSAISSDWRKAQAQN